jgi:glycosyltransferase involved in cell wall biosynthesis
LNRRERIDRSRSRAWALQVLYRWEAGGGETDLLEVLNEVERTRRIAPRRRPWVEAIVRTIQEHRDELDRALSSVTRNWRLDRLSASIGPFSGSVPLSSCIWRGSAPSGHPGGRSPGRALRWERLGPFRERRPGCPLPRASSRRVTPVGRNDRSPAEMTDPDELAGPRLLILNWQDRENPQAGGAEAHLHEVFGRLHGDGMGGGGGHLGMARGRPQTELDGIRIHRVGSRYSYPFRLASYVKRELGHLRFDLVVEDLNKVPVFAPAWAPAPTLLLVHHLFGPTAFQEASLPLALVTWLLERPIPRAYRDVPVVAVSESTRQDLIHRGMEGSRIQVIPNGIDLEHFTPGGEEDRFPEPTLLYLGRLKRYKRVDLVLAATAELRRKGVPVRLWWRVGGPPGRPGAGGPPPGAFGWGGRVPGVRVRGKKLELLRRAWVHLLTSPNEGWGIANLEAAACGTPTVASDAPGSGTRFATAKRASWSLTAMWWRWLVAPASCSAIHDLRQTQGHAARRFAEGFSWEASASAMDRALRERLVP